jgi:hypothetical protein
VRNVVVKRGWLPKGHETEGPSVRVLVTRHTIASDKLPRTPYLPFDSVRQGPVHQLYTSASEYGGVRAGTLNTERPCSWDFADRYEPR